MSGRSAGRLIRGVVLACFIWTPAGAGAQWETGAGGPVVANFSAVLQPGVWQGWVMAPSSVCGPYVVEVSPLAGGAEGDRVERAVVEPECDGTNWTDVLRAMIPADQPPMSVNLRVYRSCRLPLLADFDVVLEPGEAHGWVLGPASPSRAFAVEVTPSGPSSNGASLERVAVQEEYFMGEWKDVLRVQIPTWQPALPGTVRIFDASRLPVTQEFEVDLPPGTWEGFPLRPSAEVGGYLVEVTPVTAPSAGGYVEQSEVLPEFDGSTWRDVLRLRSQPGAAETIRVRVRVRGKP